MYHRGIPSRPQQASWLPVPKSARFACFGRASDPEAFRRLGGKAAGGQAGAPRRLCVVTNQVPPRAVVCRQPFPRWSPLAFRLFRRGSFSAKLLGVSVPVLFRQSRWMGTQASSRLRFCSIEASVNPKQRRGEGQGQGPRQGLRQISQRWQGRGELAATKLHAWFPRLKDGKGKSKALTLGRWKFQTALGLVVSPVGC